METFHSIFTGIILVILIFAVVFLFFYLKHKKEVIVLQPIPQVEIPIEKQTVLPMIHIDDLHKPISHFFHLVPSSEVKSLFT